MKTLSIHSKILYLLTFISLLSISSASPQFKENDLRQTGSIVFGVIGDYGRAGQPAADVANLVKRWNPNFIVTVGDNNYPDGAAYSMDQNIGQYYHDYIFKYNGKYGGGSATQRFFPALGNHDWHDYSPNAYTNYFTLFGNERYYDFTQGPVHFFVLDSIAYEPDGNTVDSTQARWLKNALAMSASQFNVVVTHYAPYSSGKHGPVTFMQWPFKEWGADVVLAGHDHHYERLIVNGMTYFVNGVGGAELTGFRSDILPESRSRYSQDFGAMRVEATDAYMKFQFFTRGNILIDEYILGSSIPNVSSISSANPNLSAANNLDFNIAFTEPVSGVDISDFAITANGISGAYIGAVNGFDANYVVSVNTGAGSGDLRLDLMDNRSIVNIYGSELGNTSGEKFSSETFTIDKAAPMVYSITRAHPSPTNAASVDFALALSEPVSGVDISDFILATSSGATISGLSGSGAAYLISVNTGSADDSLRLDMLANGSVTDMAGNSLGGNFALGEAYTVDRIAPNVISILRANLNPSSAAYVDFNVTFSESVLNVDAADFTLNAFNINDAYIANINGGGNSYVVSVNTGSGNGDLRLDLTNALGIVDLLGNTLGSLYAGETYTIDKSAPVVISILRADITLSNAGSLNFNVTFSEPVLGVDNSDFALNTTGISGAYVSAISGGDLNYVISVNTGIGDGIVRLDLIDNDSIVNLAGNPLGTLGVGNGNFISADSYTIDKTLPFVVSILRVNPSPSAAANLDFVVNFNESVSGVDVSDFILNTANGAFISAVSGSASSYVVSITTGTGIDSPRLDMLSNGSVIDPANNAANVNFTSGETYTINKIPPVVVSILRSNPNPATAVIADFIVNFSEPVSGVDISDFLLTTSGVSGASILSMSGSGAAYTVSALTGVGSGTLRLDLVDNNSIVNLMGNALGGINVNDGSFAGEIYEASKSTVEVKEFPVPTLISPLNNQTLNGTPSFSWFKIRDTQFYEISISNNSVFTKIAVTQISISTEFSITTLLDGTYYWRVRAYTANGQPGKFSAAQSFILDTTPPPTPVLLNPLNSARLSARFNFVWVNNGAARYQIEIDNNSDFSSPEWSSWRRDSNYILSAMSKGVYYWRVRAKDMIGNWSAWSETFKLIVP